MPQSGVVREGMPGAPNWTGVVDIGFLTEEERDLIMDVLRRDERLRIYEKQRIVGLRKELRDIRRKGAKQTDRKYGSNVCARCNEKMGIVLNKPAMCPVCKHKTCKNCRIPINKSWKCIVCFKEAKVKARTGEWFHEIMRPELKELVDGSTTLKHAVIRTMAPVPRYTFSMESVESIGSSTESRSRRKSISTRSGRSLVETGSIESLRNAKQQKVHSFGRHTVSGIPSIEVEMVDTDNTSCSWDQDYRSDLPTLSESDDARDVDTLSLRRGTKSLTAIRPMSRSVPTLPTPSVSQSASLPRASKLVMPGQMKGVTSRSVSHLSERSSLKRTNDAVGEIKFSLTYNYKTSTLVVFIVECRYLDVEGEHVRRFDPYVKCYLLPDRSVKRKSSSKKNTSSPKFNQELKFHLRAAEMSNRVLEISVWNAATLTRNCFLGHVQIALDGGKFSDIPHWYPLKPKDPGLRDVSTYKGDIHLSVRYEPPSASVMNFGELHVLVKEAKNLLPMLPDGTTHVYACLHILPEKSTRRKTNPIGGCNNPTWNANFELPLRSQNVEKCGLQVTLWHQPPKSRSDKAQHVFIGGIRLSPFQSNDTLSSTREELKMWNKVVHSPSTSVDLALPLRTF